MTRWLTIKRLQLAMLVASLVLAACGESGRSYRQPIVEDSAGVRIVTNPEQLPDLPRWEISANPTVEIGRGDSSEQELYRVRGAVRLSDGRIVVANGGSSELRFYGQDGEHLQSVGGSGEGPGEFREIRNLGSSRGDTLFVYDVGLNRVSVFSSTGDYVRGFRLETGPGAPVGTPEAVFGDGSLLVQGFLSLDEVPSGRLWNRVKLYRFSSTGEFIADLELTSGGETYYEPFDDGGFWFTRPLFARRTQRVAKGMRLYRGANDSYEVEVWNADGHLELLIRRTVEPRRITDREVARQAEELLNQQESEYERRRMREAFDEMPLPDVMPAFGRLQVDDEGNVWLEEYRVTGRDPSHWMIFGADGLLKAELDWPAGVVPHHIGSDFVLGVRTDELEVEYVVLYGITKP